MGEKSCLNGTSKVNRQTHRHTHIWTNRLIESLDKLVQDQFLQIVKDHQGDKFGYVGKIMKCFFLQVSFKMLVIKNPA